jgi:dihydroxyacetone kinase
MVHLVNVASDFTSEFSAGLAAANPLLLKLVPGGIARRAPVQSGRPVVVTGGGTGHFPAFGGLVGPGIADGAALGSIFASPSARQIVQVSTAVNAGGGVLFAYNNYAGDVLNFRQAAEQLESLGVPTRTVLVTDDISSATASESERRRGVAGSLAVYKVAGAAVAEGRTLDEAADLALRANERTRTLGVAFSGCTLPGAESPLFTVEDGRMAVGMGIHGEPGVDEMDIPSAAELATLLVRQLIADYRPADAGSRVVVLLNGLGSVKYEDLYVLFGSIAERLGEAGVVVVDAEVGEFVTSFDMAGLSLTLFWVDDDLERLWLAPCDTVGYRGHGSLRGALIEAVGPADTVPSDTPAPIMSELSIATEESREAARRALTALAAIHETLVENADELGRLDAIAGDGDHGIGMVRGASAAVAAAERAVEDDRGLSTTLAAAADAWSDRAGGTSGVLWGIALKELAGHVRDDRAPTRSEISDGVRQGWKRISEFGRANQGDKTILDAYIPFAEQLEDHLAEGMDAAWRIAVDAATLAASSTADLVPRVGRARPLAERSLGTPDPGAVSFALVVGAAGDALWKQRNEVK